jgi:hypothetical protein
MRVLPTTIACMALAAAASCASEPETVLQSDLPQVPGLTPRDSSGIVQAGGRVTGGQFAYKGFVEDLPQCVTATRARYEGAGWRLWSETVTGATAVLEFRKDSRSARVEIIRNQVQPRMSTAVLKVIDRDAAAPAPGAPAAPASPAVTPAVTPASPTATPASPAVTP